MKTEKINLESITQQKFFKLWEETWVKDIEVETKMFHFFKPVIENISRLSLGEYYWQIFDNSQPFPKIIMADGAIEKLTTFDATSICKASAADFFSTYYPADLNHVLSFISKIFRIIIDEKPENRAKYSISIFARILNNDGEYIWNSIQYPALFFDESDQFLCGMVLYTNINHLIKDKTEPQMTVLYSDGSNQQKLYQYSINEEGIEKFFPTVSPREKEIIVLLGQGLSSKQIADVLSISKNTVDNHRQRLLKKFDVKSSSELVVKSMLF